MLKGISPVISPELIKILMEMGHGDELVIADGNFPAASVAQRLVRADGLAIPPLLEAILQVFPLDQYVEQPLASELPALRTVAANGRRISLDFHQRRARHLHARLR